jgi:hypothetical protein
MLEQRRRLLGAHQAEQRRPADDLKPCPSKPCAT